MLLSFCVCLEHQRGSATAYALRGSRTRTAALRKAPDWTAALPQQERAIQEGGAATPLSGVARVAGLVRCWFAAGPEGLEALAEVLLAPRRLPETM